MAKKKEALPLILAAIKSTGYGFVVSHRYMKEAPVGPVALWLMSDGTVRWKTPEIPEVTNERGDTKRDI